MVDLPGSNRRVTLADHAPLGQPDVAVKKPLQPPITGLEQMSAGCSTVPCQAGESRELEVGRALKGNVLCGAVSRGLKLNHDTLPTKKIADKVKLFRGGPAACRLRWRNSAPPPFEPDPGHAGEGTDSGASTLLWRSNAATPSVTARFQTSL